VLDPPIVQILNQRLKSQLRVEIEEVVRASRTGQVNLSALADQIQTALDSLKGASADELRESRTSGDTDFRIVWHARPREAGEESDPVIV
jgi:allophanate hydrolase subunit 1